MTTGREFDLDEILGPKYVRHYLRFIQGAGQTFYVGTDVPPDTAWRRQTPPEEPERPAADIEKIGWGPDTCTSSVALATIPGFVWDVCGYYRRLGVPWWATRTQIRLAGLKRGALVRPRLLYALNQLLSRKIRRAYDAAVPTEPFLLDYETNDRIKRAAALAAVRWSIQQGREVTADEVLDSWGLKQNATRQEAMAGQAPDAATPLPGRPLGDSLRGWQGQWSYYIMGRADWDMTEDEVAEQLESWQYLLRRELARRGIVIRFAVGLCEGTFEKLWSLSGGTCIVFLGRDQQLTRDAVRQAADRIIVVKGLPNANANRLQGF